MVERREVWAHRGIVASLVVLAACGDPTPVASKAATPPPPPTGASTVHVAVAPTVVTTTAGDAIAATTTTAPAGPTTAPRTAAPATGSPIPARAATPPAAPAPSPPCAPAPPGVAGLPPATTQLVTVVAPVATTTSASLEAWQRSGACWSVALGPWPARIGVNGLSSRHVEGDGTTPIGTYSFGPVVYGLAPDPGVHLRYHRLACGDWWDEDPSSPGYNTFQSLPCAAAAPFAAGSEALWTETVAYQSLAVIGYNTDPVVRGAGSGIFLHADTGSATAGCVSLPLADLDAVLRWLEPVAHPAIAVGTPASLPG